MVLLNFVCIRTRLEKLFFCSFLTTSLHGQFFFACFFYLTTELTILKKIRQKQTAKTAKKRKVPERLCPASEILFLIDSFKILAFYLLKPSAICSEIILPWP